MKTALVLLLLMGAFILPAQERCGATEAASNISDNPPSITVRETAVLPVAVHIVWHTLEENISDEQVASQIAALNRDFRALNVELPDVHPLFDELAADVEIEFCLTAITRTQTPWEGVSSLFAQGKRRVCHTDLGGRDAIDPAHYINIWVAGRGDGTLGSATFPEEAQQKPNEDGLFLRPDVFGTQGNVSAPFDLGRTCTHEMGHYLNLRHLWGSTADNFGCEGDDGLADTPKQANTYRNTCPTIPPFSCGSADMFMNFMNYTDDACMALFTPDQKARMWQTLMQYRSGLLQSSCDLVSQSTVSTVPPPRLLGNPARGVAYLQLSAKEQYEIAIFDAAGRLVLLNRHHRGGDLAIDLSGWTAGIYHIKIKNGAHLHLKKLIIAQ